MTREDAHDKWHALTRGGQDDTSVSDVRNMFVNIRVSLVARHAVSQQTLDALVVAEEAAVHDVKTRLVMWGQDRGLV